MSQAEKENKEPLTRSFIAVAIPDGIKNQLSGLQSKLKRAGADVKWTRPAGRRTTMDPDPRVSHFGVQLGAKTGGARTTKVDFTLWVQDCLAGNDGPAEEAETLTR